MIRPAVFASVAFAIISTWLALRGRDLRPYWRVCALLLWSGIALMTAGELGVTIDEQGVVREFGPTLPLGAMAIFLGSFGMFVLLCITAIKRLRAKFAARAHDKSVS
jgi:hypothetical protein